MDSLQLLKEMFPGQVNLPLLDAAKAIGYAKQTTKNMVSAGLFPIPVRNNGRKRVCHILNVAAYLDGQHFSRRKKRGAPTKAERMAHVNQGED